MTVDAIGKLIIDNRRGRMTIDPVTTEVVASRLREIASTMEYALYHSGYSPILRESKDGTAGLTDADGRVVIISGGLQYHFTAYQQAVQAVLARYPAAGLKPGDSFITNDPYKGGSPHVPDFVALTPAFHGGVLIGFGVSLAHKSDIGGLVPGSSGAAAREIYHDGLLLPPVRFQTDAGIDEAVEAIIANNSRVADVVLGDLRAQVGCTRLGAARLAALCDEYGRDTALRRDGEPRSHLTARRVRRRAAIVAATARPRPKDFSITTAPTKRPAGAHRVCAPPRAATGSPLDFTGSVAADAPGRSIWSAATTQAASLLAVLATCDPTIPVNFGSARRGRLRHAGRARGQSAPPGDGQPLLPDRAPGLQHRAVGARPAQPGARGGAVRPRLRCGHDRLSQAPAAASPPVLYELAEHLARRHQPARRRRDRDGDEPLHRRARRSKSSRANIRCGCARSSWCRTRPGPVVIAAASAMRASSRCWRTACSRCARPTIRSRRGGLAGGASPKPSRVILNPHRADRQSSTASRRAS